MRNRVREYSRRLISESFNNRFAATSRSAILVLRFSQEHLELSIFPAGQKNTWNAVEGLRKSKMRARSNPEPGLTM